MEKNETKELLKKLGDAFKDNDIERQTLIIEELENKLPFINQKVKDHWLGVVASFKFWEDLEEETLKIIDQKEAKDFLEETKKELEEHMNDISLDFVSDYDIESDNYLSDLFSEMSDNDISVYYADQEKYFNEHTRECEDTLLNYYNSDDLADYIKKNGLEMLICHAGVCGWYESNYSQLSEDEENIKKLLIIRYLLNKDIYTLSLEKIEALLDEAENTNIDRISELLDMVQNYIFNE